MSESKTSDEIPVTFSLVVYSVNRIVEQIGTTQIGKTWILQNPISTALCIGSESGFITGFTPEGEESVRKAFDSLAKAFNVSTYQLRDIAMGYDKEYTL